FEPMHQVNQNPPLVSYMIAAVAGIVGFDEASLHIAFLLAAIGAVLGTWQLAREHCRHPTLAASIALATPVFLVSATAVMCDVLLLCLWTWSAVFWDRALRNGHWRDALIGSVVAGLAVLTKFAAVNLILLLALWTFLHPGRRRLAAFLLAP